jgi:hypothetical protein
MVRFIRSSLVLLLLNISLKLVSFELRLTLDLGRLALLRKQSRVAELTLPLLLKIAKRLRLGAHSLMQATLLKERERLARKCLKLQRDSK